MARYDPDWVRAHYDEYGTREWNRWEESGVERIKFHIHLYYLQTHVRPGGRVLEIGAGAGRFTRELARICERIVVADLSPGQLRLNRENAARLGFAPSVEDWVECDLCDLTPHFADGTFETIVCTGGPLSYVFERRDDAVRELYRVAKDGGTLVISVMSLWGAVHQFLPGILDIAPAANRAILATGDLSPETIGPARHYTHMYRSDELRRTLEDGGWAVETMSASNCLATNWVDLLDDLDERGPIWAHLLEMELEACREPGCVDMGSHMIAVCRKAAS